MSAASGARDVKPRKPRTSKPRPVKKAGAAAIPVRMRGFKNLPAVGRVQGREAQPLNEIVWRHRSTLHANNYNPNSVAPPELELLVVSILEDGWTQPLVVRPDQDAAEGVFEIVDGFHRWTVSEHPLVYSLTDGYVPTVTLAAADRDHQMMSTIRHNRARGAHAVLKMADIVCMLIDDLGLSYEQVQDRLGMEWEEVDRLHDRGGMLKRGSAADFNKGWVPV